MWAAALNFILFFFLHTLISNPFIINIPWVINVVFSPRSGGRSNNVTTWAEAHTAAVALRQVNVCAVYHKYLLPTSLFLLVLNSFQMCTNVEWQLYIGSYKSLDPGKSVLLHQLYQALLKRINRKHFHWNCYIIKDFSEHWLKLQSCVAQTIGKVFGNSILNSSRTWIY